MSLIEKPCLEIRSFPFEIMTLEQVKEFLQAMQENSDLKKEVLSSSTADDVAQIAQRLGYEVSGDELLRFSGNKVGRVTVKKNDIPGEYN